MNPTTLTVLTAQSSTAELASLIDERIRVTTPHGRTVEGVLSVAVHRERGGLRIHWSGGDEHYSYVPYGSTVEIVGGVR